MLQELYEELPTLYDQRIPNVASHLQTLYAAEATVMAEFSKVSITALNGMVTMVVIHGKEVLSVQNWSIDIAFLCYY